MDEKRLTTVQNFAGSAFFNDVREYMFAKNSTDGEVLAAIYRTFEEMKTASVTAKAPIEEPMAH